MSTQTESPVNPSENSPNVTEHFANIYSRLSQFNVENRELQYEVKELYKEFKRERTKLSKHRRKKNNTKIHMPMKVTKELTKFLSLKAGTLLSKKTAMQQVSTYVKKNNLQLKDNRRMFKPNAKLRRLFKMEKSVPMTFVEINKYISPHFLGLPTTQ